MEDRLLKYVPELELLISLLLRHLVIQSHEGVEVILMESQDVLLVEKWLKRLGIFVYNL